MEWLLLLLLGFGTGAYGVIVGAGGGFILAPALIIFFDMEPTVVAGTSLALVAVNALSGSQVYRRMGLVDYRSGLLFAAAAIPGAILAPFILTSVADGTFRILLGAVLLGLAVQMIWRPPCRAGSPEARARGQTQRPGPEPTHLDTGGSIVRVPVQRGVGHVVQLLPGVHVQLLRHRRRVSADSYSRLRLQLSGARSRGDFHLYDHLLHDGGRDHPRLHGPRGLVSDLRLGPASGS